VIALDPSLRRCPSCGAPVAEGAATCTYCQAPLAWGGRAPMTPHRSVRDAATEWARHVIGAPRHFADLIQSVQVRDEVFDRVFTTTVRRDVGEERVATNQRRSQAPRVDPSSVDPFAISAEALRTQSEHVTGCTTCGGSGSATCPGCGGDGRTRCHNCGGSGQERRYYKKTSRLVKCSVCRATGTVTCGTCDGGGSVTCRGCNGSGHQLAWLTYDERSRGYASIAPESPIHLAHHQLLEHHPLAPTDLQAFGTLISEEAHGPLGHSDGMNDQFLRAQTSSLDPRLERVSYQQYLKIAIVRRDATYEMCGTTGVLVLSGGNLVGSRTKDALRPIRRRLNLWFLLTCVLLAAMMVLFGSLRGRTPYFDRSNEWLMIAGGVVTLFGGVFAAAALRALRPGFRFGRLGGVERAIGVCALASLCGGLLVFALHRPSVAEARRALASGDTARAQLVVDALQSMKGDTQEVLETEDAVMLAHAQSLTGDDKLQVLDKVAARNGTLAKQAADAARTERITEIHQLIDDKHPTDAIARIDRWWPGTWQGDHDLAELRATAQDQAFTACPDDPCRYSSTALASAAAATPDRAARTAAARQTLLADLSFSEIAGEPMLTRLQRLRTIAATAARTSEVAGSDQELGSKASTVAKWAAGERAKVPLLAADEPIAAELLGSVSHQSPTVDVATLDGVLAFLSIDAQKKCRGVYLVGPAKGARSLDAAPDTTIRVLSQAVGHPATIKKPAKGASSSQWMEGGTLIVGRWSNDALVELRVGDATP
jgi:hypothetical protein